LTFTVHFRVEDTTYVVYLRPKVIIVVATEIVATDSFFNRTFFSNLQDTRSTILCSLMVSSYLYVSYDSIYW